MEFLRETTIFKRIISSITKRIFQFFRLASLFLYLLYDIKISLKKMNSELWKILCFKISSERLLYDSFFFFLRRYTTIYNIDNFYRIYIVNFLKIKIKMIMCMEKKLFKKFTLISISRLLKFYFNEILIFLYF